MASEKAASAPHEASQLGKASYGLSIAGIIISIVIITVVISIIVSRNSRYYYYSSSSGVSNSYSSCTGYGYYTINGRCYQYRVKGTTCDPSCCTGVRVYANDGYCYFNY
jgi:hypothetical protein